MATVSVMQGLVFMPKVKARKRVSIMAKNIYGNDTLTLEQRYCLRLESSFEDCEEEDNQLCLFDIYEAIKRGVSDEFINMLIETYNECFNENYMYDVNTKTLI